MYNSPNPMLGLLNQPRGLSQTQLNNISQVRNLMNIFKKASNPQALLKGMIERNPQLKNVMDYVQSHGGDPEKAFYAMAKEKGINPDEVIKLLQQ